MPSAYSDGVYLLDDSLPSARLVSDIVFKGTDGLQNERNLTTMFAYFSKTLLQKMLICKSVKTILKIPRTGQVIAYEIMQASDVSCPLEMYKIQVNKCDRVFDAQCEGDSMMPFLRAKYDKESGEGLNSPREQVITDYSMIEWWAGSIQ